MLLETTPCSIYHRIKLKALEYFLSIFGFSVVCKNYCYRERNEIVNEQAIIEEQYERELMLNQKTLKTLTQVRSTRDPAYVFFYEKL